MSPAGRDRDIHRKTVRLLIKAVKEKEIKVIKSGKEVKVSTFLFLEMLSQETLKTPLKSLRVDI